VGRGKGSLGKVELAPAQPHADFWRRQNVLLTGHTGFKGGWLATWLLELGARVAGLALPPDPGPSFFQACALGDRLASRHGDVRDAAALRACLQELQPTIVFHLAAQSLVRRSFREPRSTFDTNVMGTVNVLEAVKATPSVRAVVVVTSDKCYAHREGAPHREGDRLGGSDPYSASKACAEIVCEAYRRSFFTQGAGLATVRAGNVFGGGDWAEDRLVPDAMRALAGGLRLSVRYPEAIRPWQHVLEPLLGYMVLAERLAQDPARWAGPWNFGPHEKGVTVGALAELLVRAWGEGTWSPAPEPGAPPESPALRLDSSKAERELGWRPRLSLQDAVALTIEWYRRALSGDRADAMLALSRNQIRDYVARPGAGAAAAWPSPT
jgi:CDP-glucose 4,6-dehydratase